jgi:sugar phosphate isomerase/epimerase
MLAAAGCRPAAVAASLVPPRRLDRVGLQIYSVRSLLEKRFEETLAELAVIGYRDVEWWGSFDRTPAQIRTSLDRAGLASPSGHFDYADVRDDTARVLDRAATMGHQFVTAAWIDEAARRTLSDWHRIADELNRIGNRAHSAGRRFAYHNHDYEFKPVDGQTPLAVLLARTDPKLVEFELDIYWMVSAGNDPVEYITMHPNRFVMFHVKDSAGPPKHEQVDVGSGRIAFAPILRAATEHGGIRYAFAEHDDPADPLHFAKRSYDYLKNLEF